MDRYNSLADALECEVLTEMAGTFFGARKALEELLEAFAHSVAELKSRQALVISRVFYLRSLLLGQEGEQDFYAALGINQPFPDCCVQSGSRTWRPENLPFALFASSRYVKAVLQAYAEVCRACEVYMNGQYEDDPEHKGRKRLSLNYAMVERMCRRLNERIDKLNGDMPPSSVLQYARNISSAEQPGEGAITNVLGAESLDKGLMFDRVDMAAQNVWKAPSLPPAAKVEARILAFAREFYGAHTERIRRMLDDM